MAGILWSLNKMIACHLQGPCPENNQVRGLFADSFNIQAIYDSAYVNKKGPQ
jgi:hypothetical protein